MPSPTPAPDLSVVIPAFNEEERLGQSLERILAHLGDGSERHEILVVDDGSRDATATVAEAYAEDGVRVLRLDRNRGKGAAVRRGVAASAGRRVLLTDADLSAPIEELAKLEPRLGEAQVVLGSRAVAGSRITLHQPLYRELMGKTFNRLIRLAGVGRIHDTQCGFKLLDGDVGREVFRRMITDGFAFDVELVWLAQRLGHRVVEVGVAWEDSPSSRVRVLADPPRMLLEIVRFRWHHRSL